MSSILKVFLLLAVMLCISQAQIHVEERLCLCQRVRDAIGKRSEIQDLEVYPPTIFCSKVEIVVTMKSGLRYCLNPELRAVQRLLANVIGRQRTATAKPTEVSSTSGSSI